MANCYTRECKFGRTIYLNEFMAYHDPVKNPFNEALVKQDIAKAPEESEIYERPWSLKRKTELNFEHLQTLMCHEMPEPCHTENTTMRGSYQNPHQAERIMTQIRIREAAIGIIPGVSPDGYCEVEFLEPKPLVIKDRNDDSQPEPCPRIKPCDCCYPRQKDDC